MYERVMWSGNPSPTIHKTCYPGCVGRSPFWLFSPFGLNLLLAVMRGADGNKYFKIQNSLKTKKLCKMKTGLFYTSSHNLGEHFKKKLFNEIVSAKVDLKDNVPTALEQWVKKYGDYSGFCLTKNIPSDTTFALANVSTFESGWKARDTGGRSMIVHNSFKYTQDIDYEARIIELPLQDEELKVIVLVPNEVDLLHTLYRRLANEGLAASYTSIQPLFSVDSVFQAPSIAFASQTFISLAQENDNNLSNKSLIQFGNVLINENGATAKVLTCLYSSKSPPSSPKISSKPQEKAPFFFAITFKDTPLFTGQYMSS